MQVQGRCPHTLNTGGLCDDRFDKLFDLASTSIVQLVQDLFHVGRVGLVAFQADLVYFVAFRSQVIGLDVGMVPVTDSHLNLTMRTCLGPLYQLTGC